MEDVSFELLLASDVRGLRVATCADRRDDAFESAIARVVDYVSALVILQNLVHFCIEASLLVQLVGFPNFSDLRDNLLTVGISALPVHGGEEAIH